ncbi:MAG TPA: aminopeptidase, partial [Rikenellaceae bacterium]|nr:aminopeptidase [Rikenellaceae bacterium]
MARNIRLKFNGFISLLAFSSILLFPNISSGSVSHSQSDTLIAKVESIRGISDVKTLESRHFNQKYTLFIDQPLDHDNPAAGTFRQRVFVMNISQERPTVIVTEGYGAGYVVNPAYREELSRLFNANIIFV